MQNRTITWAFGLCFVVALLAASKAQQLSGGGGAATPPCTTIALSLQINNSGSFGCATEWIYTSAKKSLGDGSNFQMYWDAGNGVLAVRNSADSGYANFQAGTTVSSRAITLASLNVGSVGSAYVWLDIAGDQFTPGGVFFRTASVVAWNNGTDAGNGTQDTIISRNAAGVVQFGTTTANASGSALMTGLTATGTAVVFSGVSADTATADATACIKSSDGTLLKGSGTIGICLGTSSARYKQPETFRPLTDGIEQIAQLKPLNYRYIKGYGDDGAREQYGLLAEEVVDVLPKLVGMDEEGKPNSVDLVGIIPIIIRALQELKADNDNLRRELRQQKAER